MSNLFSFRVGVDSYVVDEPDRNPDQWLITAEEKYRPDKEKFILDKFRKDFSNIRVRDSQQVYNLASRSVKLNEWLAKTNVEYAVIEGAPTYFRQYVDPQDFDSASKEVLRISKANAEKAQRQAEAAVRYRESLVEIDKEFENKLKVSDKIAKILSLNSTLLPLSIQLAIDNYTPAAQSTVNQKAYARECLVNYKIKLLEALKKDKNLDIDKVIVENLEK